MQIDAVGDERIAIALDLSEAGLLFSFLIQARFPDDGEGGEEGEVMLNYPRWSRDGP